MKLPLEGGCLCGAVRYRISLKPRSADYCHCRMCRRAAGAPVVARLIVANAGFAWITGGPAVYRTSAEAERLFCAACGTQLALRDEPDYLDVTLASLGDPEAVRPSCHIWTASRIGWFEVADDLPRYPNNRRVNPGWAGIMDATGAQASRPASVVVALEEIVDRLARLGAKRLVHDLELGHAIQPERAKVLA